MSYRIDEIEGIGPAYAEKLGRAKITTTEELLNLCCKPDGRKRMASETGIQEKLLLKWANMADLMRLKGVGPEFAELLEAAGVDTIKEFRTRNPENLAQKMREVNEAKKLTRAVPSETQVRAWIDNAGKMDPKITH